MVQRPQRDRRQMTARRTREIAAVPSGHVGVHRARGGKGWDAYVMERDLVRLGTFPSKDAAVAARADYWKAREPGR